MPIPIDRPNLDREYRSLMRHWSPLSETYAGGDALLAALDQGWQIAGAIEALPVTLHSVCGSSLYTIRLVRRGETMVMPVLSNPYVDRFVAAHNRANAQERGAQPATREIVSGRSWT